MVFRRGLNGSDRVIKDVYFQANGLYAILRGITDESNKMFSLKLKTYYKGPKSNTFDGKRFFNVEGDNRIPTVLDLLKWRLFDKARPWPKYVENKFDDIPPQRVPGTDIRISFVGHVTILIQTQNLNILTDPVWSNRASPFQLIGPRRINKPGIEFEHLPPIDAVWVSHNHYDHLDLPILKKLWDVHRPRIITPLGNDVIMQKAGITAEAYDLGENVCLKEGITLHLEPMLHWSARGLFDRNKALWAAMVLETPSGNLYYVGDTGYGEGVYFKQVAAKFKSFRACFLPIGAYEPRWFMKNVHMNPEEALKARHHLGNPLMIPMHYDTFPLANEGYKEALGTLKEHLKTYSDNQVKILEIGEHFLLAPNVPA